MELDLHSLTTAQAAELLAKRACVVRMVKKAGLFKAADAGGFMSGMKNWASNNKDSLMWGLGGAGVGAGLGAASSYMGEDDGREKHPWRNALTGAIAGGALAGGGYAGTKYLGQVLHPGDGSTQQNQIQANSLVNANKNLDWANKNRLEQFLSHPLDQLNEDRKDIPHAWMRGAAGSATYNTLLNSNRIRNAANYVGGLFPTQRPSWLWGQGMHDRFVKGVSANPNFPEELKTDLGQGPAVSRAYVKALAKGIHPTDADIAQLNSKIKGGLNPNTEAYLNRVATTRRMGSNTVAPNAPDPVPAGEQSGVASDAKKQLKQVYQDAANFGEGAEGIPGDRLDLLNRIPGGQSYLDEILHAANVRHGKPVDGGISDEKANIKLDFLDRNNNEIQDRLAKQPAKMEYTSADVAGRKAPIWRAGAPEPLEGSRMGGSTLGQAAAFVLPAWMGHYNNPDKAFWEQQQTDGNKYMAQHPEMQGIVDQLMKNDQ
jgi:hypothetical protein